MPAFQRRVMARARRKKHRAAFRLIAAGLILLGLYILFNIELMPSLKAAATYRARTAAINTINSAVGTVLKRDGTSYEKLMTIDRDTSGDITSVEADSMQINLLKYDITNEVLKQLNNMNETSDIGIPLGTVFGGPLLAGRGPFVHIKVYPTGTVNSEITSTFSSAGINQTRQQIELYVKADLAVMISAYNVGTQVSTNFTIADSVIVGSVPNSYTVVDGESDTSNKIFTYGQNRQ